MLNCILLWPLRRQNKHAPLFNVRVAYGVQSLDYFRDTDSAGAFADRLIKGCLT